MHPRADASHEALPEDRRRFALDTRSAASGVYLWASTTSSRLLARTFEIHTVDFPIPFPLSEEERQELGLADEEVERVATERAVERGKHLVEARYGCLECHGADFSGGVMLDVAPIGQLLGPNITNGRGSRAEDFGPSEWDRIVRHGVRADGRPAAMPSGDFQLMSDQELSDIIAYVSTQPAVDNEVPAVTLGPLGKSLVATGQFPLSVDLIHSPTMPSTRRIHLRRRCPWSSAATWRVSARDVIRKISQGAQFQGATRAGCRRGTSRPTQTGSGLGATSTSLQQCLKGGAPTEPSCAYP